MELNELTYSDFEKESNHFFTTIKPHQEISPFKVKASKVEKLEHYGIIKDNLYEQAILNLIKKNNFLQLYIQLIDEQISESEYDKELTENAEKYFVTLKAIDSEFKFATLIRIVQNLPKIFSVDQISEIFGIKPNSIVNRLSP